MSMLTAFTLFYSLLALTHIGIQLVLAGINHRRQYTTHNQIMHQYNVRNQHPKVSIIIPAHNEPVETMERCLSSISNLSYPDLNVIVVDDGSTNRLQLETVYTKYEAAGFTVLRQANAGKREAQAHAMNYIGDSKYVVTIDSDTVLNDPNSVTTLVAHMENNSNLGAVTGQVLADNTGDTLLSRLIGLRYWMAFNQERAPQSHFGVVSCASGPFSMYRASVIRGLMGAYTSQTFMGTKCTFGDDRHLTNLILEQGHDVTYVEKAVAHTIVPTTIPAYLKQQLRWSKSFYRELLWTAKFTHKRHAYMGYDLAVQALMPFLLIIALGLAAYQAITVDPMIAAKYAGIVTLIGMLRAAYGFTRTGDKGFALFALYGFLHVSLLIPTRIVALATMTRNGWGTRSAKDMGITTTRNSDHTATSNVLTTAKGYQTMSELTANAKKTTNA